MATRFALLCWMAGISILWAQTETYRGGDHELLIAPTAYTMPKGYGYLTDYEIVFLSAGYALTSRTHLSAFFAFPVFADFLRAFSIGVKQNYLSISPFASAAWATYIFEAQTIILGNAFSLGTMESNFTVNVAWLKQFGKDGEGLLFSIGGALGISTSAKLLGEVIFSSESFQGSKFESALLLGIRFYGERFSLDLAGIRPVGTTSNGSDAEDLIAVPYLKASYIFIPDPESK